MVHLDLRAVGLDLREVGIVSEIERQVGCQPILEIEAALRLCGLGKPAGGGVQAADLHRRHRRQQLEVAAGGQPADPLEQPHLG